MVDQKNGKEEETKAKKDQRTKILKDEARTKVSAKFINLYNHN